MRLRRLAESASAAVLGLALGVATALSQGAGNEAATLDLPPPEAPALRILAGDATPPQLDIPAPPEMVLDLRSPGADDEPELAAPHDARGMTTGAISVTPQPDGDDAFLGITVPELPPVDPSLLARPAPEAEPQLARPTEPLIAPPALPEVVVTLPTGLELSARIAQRAEEALSVPRLAQRERADIIAAYAANENRPFWIDGKGWSAAGKLLVAQLARAGQDGLRPADYAVPAFEASDKDGLAEADVRLSALAVLYARDARGGRIDPRRLSKMLTPVLDLPSATEVLSELAGATDPGAVLAAYNPQHEGYRRLKAKLATLRTDKEDVPSVRIPAGPPLRLGMRDQRVPLVRARLGLGASEEPVFDRSTATALAEFQKQAGLRADGVLSNQTLAALGSPPAARLESDIVAQMERWRWLPADLGASHVMVNVPEFRMRMVHDGKLVHDTRVIVGKPESATPIFSHKMEYVVVNPSWYVPPSILKKEFLPGLKADPDYAAKRGYIVTRRGNSISVRQPPGERNALGWIKFMFPNDHAVYLHDTPNRRLFAGNKRALSHGCVRVENPFALADLVLGPEWTHDRLKRLIGSGERTIRLPQPLPIHLVYNTLVVNEAGAITTYDDLYGFHRLVRTALERLS
ncbi:L,D-transpeptidase family protein [Bosea rubneri]|uniref:L,D-transpeptidase family protein n=1 Tax=Bosea rubneri TaxID=3075434 RepID=A0ABU3S8U5_9HYPH|nr:L,D-transpeptidase family protein [Bosea sp. ZW T0_25]MDU0341204.1 L,D-transpeptidase family protein [Bosea sp. ZW T0_25]